ncbi:MAG: HAD family hydrolase [Alphaproteobacteria bacterium]|nr:HAD family hydrolase [Alphaproteobacteria bacterium]
MWSGPRNLSTAMMRSFGARADTAVVDEPFYAAYLATTGIAHPMREAVIAAGETDWGRVAASCAAPQGDPPIRYEKHMTVHMVDGAPLDWMDGAKIAFLIRHPAAVAASYAAKREAPTSDDIGSLRQAELYDWVADRYGPAPVVDAADIRRDPATVLSRLCRALGIPFDPAMLSWEAGPQETDGVWASHWYGAVNRSTGFAPPPVDETRTPEGLEALVEAALPAYSRLRALALTPDG